MVIEAVGKDVSAWGLSLKWGKKLLKATQTFINQIGKGGLCGGRRKTKPV